MNIRALMIKLIEHGYTTARLAELLGISKSSVYRKLSGTTEFTRQEIALIRNAFSLDDDSLVEIFFERTHV